MFPKEPTKKIFEFRHCPNCGGILRTVHGEPFPKDRHFECNKCLLYMKVNTGHRPNGDKVFIVMHIP